MINELHISEEYGHKRTHRAYNRLTGYLDALERHPTAIPSEVEEFINQELSKLEAFDGKESRLRLRMYGALNRIKKHIISELNLVPKHYYQSIWMALGMSVFGIPLGTVWFVLSDNAAYMAIGFPIGMVLGMSIGISLDRKAEQQGRQLDYGEF